MTSMRCRQMSSQQLDPAKELLLILSIVILSAPSVRAQTTGLSGLVIDQRGGQVSEVNITLASLDTGLSRSTVSDRKSVV